MAYIRPRTEELTGYQERAPYRKSIDFANDFVMVYGIDETMPQRIREYREAGYVIHLMTGISWGEYQDYLYGRWDGQDHTDEAQRQRDGQDIIHNPTVPYMVPTLSFIRYLTEKLKVAVDAGVEAIHMEEPEFWDHGGYSPAFRREFESFYGEPWRPQHTDPDALYKAGRLKSYLYCRAIASISRSLKDYARQQGRQLRFYVPTHSLLNYTQWKIISPEAELIGIPTVDGCIAQVWTGTSRCRNVYRGAWKERTFETAYLEYGVMQELVKGTGRRMWFLNDPIEDAPGYTWEDYRYNYLKTATASLLHPGIWHYEICPWPRRVVEEKYPKIQPNIHRKDEHGIDTHDARYIPRDYATQLSAMFQLFGDMDQPQWRYEGDEWGVGVLMSDSSLFQRTFPDGIVTGRRLADLPEFDPAAILAEESLMLDFIQSQSFPQFYGLALPLLKWGLPIRPVQLDNVTRFADYLADCRFLVLSYEFIKPASGQVNGELVRWVESGGSLFYVGDGSDPFHAARFWWQEQGYRNPAEHLFESLGLGRNPEPGYYPIGKGAVTVLEQRPAAICLDEKLCDDYREQVRMALERAGIHWDYRNHLTLRRGPYIISAVMSESVTDGEKVFRGNFVDLLSDGFPVVREKRLACDQCAILLDLDAVTEPFRVVATCARVEMLEDVPEKRVLRLRTAENIRSYTRLRLASAPTGVEADAPITWTWDEDSRTLLLRYESTAAPVTVTIGK